MHIQILNVANPVRPEVKLEVERDIAALMGWDILLPTQEEYKTEMDKADTELKAQLAAKTAKAEIPSVEQPQVDGEKFQGPPKPPSEEQLAKRQEGGVNVRKVGTKKGQAKSMGNTRMIQESEVEEVEETEQKPQKLEITVKSEPQITRTEITVKTPLDEKMRELAELEVQTQSKRKELAEKETKFAEEENTKKQEKLKAEIIKVQMEIKESNAAIEKLKVETEEVKKTHAKKREAMDKISRQGE
jgi:hypothetical protein